MRLMTVTEQSGKLDFMSDDPIIVWADTEEEAIAAFWSNWGESPQDHANNLQFAFWEIPLSEPAAPGVVSLSPIFLP